VDGEAYTLPFLALDLDFAAMLSNDPANNEKTEA
jgi:hypothetical protein